MQRRRARGFSLIELMVAVVLTTLLLGMGFSGLNKARTSGSSRGLATAVAAEFRLAREKAIAKGSPVAVILPQGVGRSLSFLEGDTLPVVTRTVNYAGDYPHGSIAVATYPGPAFDDNLEVPGSKSLEWQGRLAEWLPTRFARDRVFMFTPNGTVVTNDLPAADGTYRVVVATGMEVSDLQLRSAGEPQTVAVSQTGAVETFGRLLGSSGGVNTSGGPSNAVPAPFLPVVDYTPKKPDIVVSRITPPAEMVDGQMVHVLDKGEYLTLEIFAKSGDGRALYAGWKDNPLTKSGSPNIDDFKGAFSVPNGELERMEFYPEFNVADDGQAADVQKDVWRSVWTWTPPAAAEAGDQYELAVDVTDAKRVEKAKLPDLKPVVISPPGEIVFESDRTGRWQLYTMWADGSRLIRLTKDDHHDYRCASATADGKMIAYQRDNDVWVMNADGTGQVRIASNADTPTISPVGNSIAYMQGTEVVVRRLDVSSGGSPRRVASIRTGVEGAPQGNRLAYSPNGRWVYFTASDGGAVAGVRLDFSAADLDVGPVVQADGVPNTVSAKMVGGLSTDRTGRIYYHADHNDPYLGQYSVDGDGRPTRVESSPKHWRTSVGNDEAFPSVSPKGDLILFCERTAGGPYQLKRMATGGLAWTSSGSVTALTGEGNNLRPAWIHQDGSF